MKADLVSGSLVNAYDGPLAGVRRAFPRLASVGERAPLYEAATTPLIPPGSAAARSPLTVNQAPGPRHREAPYRPRAVLQAGVFLDAHPALPASRLMLATRADPIVGLGGLRAVPSRRSRRYPATPREARAHPQN